MGRSLLTILAIIMLGILIGVVYFSATRAEAAADTIGNFQTCSTIDSNWKRYGANILGANSKVSDIVRNACAAIGGGCSFVSGYRSAAYNRKVGGAGSSQHIRAGAVDLRVPSGKEKEFITLAICGLRKVNNCQGGIGLYNSNDIHIDVRSGATNVWSTGYSRSNIAQNINDPEARNILYAFGDGKCTGGGIVGDYEEENIYGPIIQYTPSELFWRNNNFYNTGNIFGNPYQNGFITQPSILSTSLNTLLGGFASFGGNTSSSSGGGTSSNTLTGTGGGFSQESGNTQILKTTSNNLLTNFDSTANTSGKNNTVNNTTSANPVSSENPCVNGTAVSNIYGNVTCVRDSVSTTVESQSGVGAENTTLPNTVVTSQVTTEDGKVVRTISTFVGSIIPSRYLLDGNTNGSQSNDGYIFGGPTQQPIYDAYQPYGGTAYGTNARRSTIQEEDIIAWMIRNDLLEEDDLSQQAILTALLGLMRPALLHLTLILFGTGSYGATTLFDVATAI